MHERAEPIDVSDLPDVLRLADEVQRTGKPRLLKSGDTVIARLSPVRSSKRAARTPRRTQVGDYNPFGNLIGIANTHGSPDDPNDVSENKYKYLADAWDPPTS